MNLFRSESRVARRCGVAALRVAFSFCLLSDQMSVAVVRGQARADAGTPRPHVGAARRGAARRTPHAAGGHSRTLNTSPLSR